MRYEVEQGRGWELGPERPIATFARWKQSCKKGCAAVFSRNAYVTFKL